jgi:YD repeat-containing protein
MKKILSMALCLGLCYCSFAQTGKAPGVVGPSPNASSLGIYGDIPTGAYTGVPNIALPLYTVAYRDIKVPISLSYHAAGIKVEQEASWVGLGWSLNAGGVITRTIRGLDDLAFYNNQTGYPFVPNMPSECQARASPNVYANFMQGNCYGNIDAEPDVFYFNMGGFSGKFLIEQNPNNGVGTELRGTLLAKSKMQVIYSWAGTTRNKGSWKIIDEQGFVYTFDVKEYSFTSTATANTFANAEYQLWQNLSITQENNDNTFIKSITGWYLSKIESPIGGLVSFVYDDASQYATQSQVSKGMSRTIPNYMVVSNFNADTHAQCSSANMSKLQTFYTTSASINKDVYLKEIKFGDGSVKFNTSNREDLLKTGLSNYTAVKFPQKLSSIEISHTATTNKITYTLGQDYFNAGGEVAQKRLRLLSLTQSDQVHRFEYDSQTLPAKNSFDQDYWGYYNASFIPNTSPLPQTSFQMGQDYPNGTTSLGVASLKNYANEVDNTTKPANKRPDALAMQAGILTKIIYPTKGSTSYVYEPHRYQTEKIPPYVGEGEKLSTSFELHTSPYNTAAPLKKTFYVSDPTKISFQATIKCIDTNPLANCEAALNGMDLSLLLAGISIECSPNTPSTTLQGTDVSLADWKYCKTGQGPNCYKVNDIPVGPAQDRTFQVRSTNLELYPNQKYDLVINSGNALPANLASKFAIDVIVQQIEVNPVTNRSRMFSNEADIEETEVKVSTSPFYTGTKTKTFTITEPTYVAYRSTIAWVGDGPNSTITLAQTEALIDASFKDKLVSAITKNGAATDGIIFFDHWLNCRPTKSGCSYGGVMPLESSNTQIVVSQPDILLQPGTYALQLYNGLDLPPDLKSRFSLSASVFFVKTPCVLTSTNTCGEKMGGGLRIKKIVQDPLTSNTRTVNYRYLNADGSSSGKLMSKVIYYGFYEKTTGVYPTPNGCKLADWGTYNAESSPTMPLGSSAQGNLVGYDRVVVFDGIDTTNIAQNGLVGANVYQFKNQSDLIDLSAFLPNSPNTNFGNSNGLLESMTVYSKDGKKVQQSLKTYSKKASLPVLGMKFQKFNSCSIVTANTTQAVATSTDRETTVTNIIIYNDGSSNYSQKQFFSSIINATNASATFSVNFRTLEMIGKKFYYTYSDFWALDSETSRTYNMNDDTKFIENTVNYNYSLADFKLKKTSTVSSAGKIQETQYFHTSDYSPSIPIVGQLIANNMYDKLLGERQLVSGNIISAKATEYNQQGLATNVHVLETAIPIAPSLSNILTFPLANVVPTELKKRMSFLYDTDNNLVEVQSISNNVIQNKTAYLWGYKGIFPVIEVQNASYASLGSGVLLNSSDVNTKAASLRSTLAKALVKSYTYDYLFGMLSTTTPNGLTNTFNYDTQGRLSTIRDPNNNLVKSYSYNYRNQ